MGSRCAPVPLPLPPCWNVLPMVLILVTLCIPPAAEHSTCLQPTWAFLPLMVCFPCLCCCCLCFCFLEHRRGPGKRSRACFQAFQPSWCTSSLSPLEFRKCLKVMEGNRQEMWPAVGEPTNTPSPSSFLAPTTKEMKECKAASLTRFSPQRWKTENVSMPLEPQVHSTAKAVCTISPVA